MQVLVGDTMRLLHDLMETLSKHMCVRGKEDGLSLVSTAAFFRSCLSDNVRVSSSLEASGDALFDTERRRRVRHDYM